MVSGNLLRFVEMSDLVPFEANESSGYLNEGRTNQTRIMQKNFDIQIVKLVMYKHEIASCSLNSFS